MFLLLSCHTLYGCVDWNQSGQWRNRWWICHTLYGCVDWNIFVQPSIICMISSHPLWVCGLKYCINHSCKERVRHTLYGCVDWNRNLMNFIREHPESHPLWVCGLKFLITSWIILFSAVTPFMGVWIEIRILLKNSTTAASSHPLWVCGLKSCNRVEQQLIFCHTLYGCVDWNFFLFLNRIAHFLSHPLWVCGLK